MTEARENRGIEAMIRKSTMLTAPARIFEVVCHGNRCHEYAERIAEALLKGG